MVWSLDVDFMFDDAASAITALNARIKETNWINFAIGMKTGPKYSLDTDWEFSTLGEALTKISALSGQAGFVGAYVRVKKA